MSPYFATDHCDGDNVENDIICNRSNNNNNDNNDKNNNNKPII